MTEKKSRVAEVATLDVVDVDAQVATNTVKLSRPLSDGRDTLELDFDRINGRTLIDCEKRARKIDPTITVLALSQVYQAMVGAAAAKMKYDAVLELSGKDFTALCVKVQSFLLP
nr:MAG TPA_asm: tail assembly chaperone protein [Caudoviricetes sp.]